MKFAINYSTESAALLSEGRIDLDMFKCPDWPHIVAAARTQRPSYVHFSPRAGRGELDNATTDHFARMLESSDTHYVSIHLAPNASDFGDMPVETRDPAHVEQLVDAVERDVALLVERFGSERIILENSMWDPDPPFEIPLPILEPQMIGDIVRRTKCGFLLDVAHANVTAKHFGMDERDYVSSLPVQQLRELHVSGLTQHADGSWEDHFPMRDNDWALIEWAVERIRVGEWPHPWVMTLEYGGVGPAFRTPSETGAIAEQAPRLYTLAKSAITREPQGGERQ